PEAADLRLLDAVVAADPDLLERQSPERGVAPGRDRIAELRPRPGATPVEVVEVELPVEGVEARGERRVPEVGLGEREDDVAADRPDVAGEADALASPEEVVLLDAGVEEERVGRAEPRAGAERPRLRLLDV